MIKDIAVALTGTDEDESRLLQAEVIAQAFDAHVIGLQVNELAEVIAITDPSGSVFLQTMITEADERADALAGTLTTRLGKMAVATELRRIDAYPNTVGTMLARAARLADLFVGTRPYGSGGALASAQETVLFNTGRACLFVPPGLRTAKPYERILVAWKDTAEAAHALAEAMPLLQRAKEVMVAIVSEGGAAEQSGQEAGTQIGRHLSRHGIEAEIRPIDGWSNVGEGLINETKMSAADLIVMGAYGHSRMREFVLGGVTRHVLSEAKVPVFAAH